MRVASPTTWLLLAALAPAASADDDAVLYFDWSNFTEWGYEVSDGSAGVQIGTSIVNYAAVNNTAMQFTWRANGRDITLQNVLLGTGTTALACGYKADNNGQPDPSATLPQFPVSTAGSLTLLQSTVAELYENNTSEVLFFQVGWTDSTGASEYGSSPAWAIVKDSQEASSLYSSMSSTGTVMRASSPTSLFPDTLNARLELPPGKPTGSGYNAAATSSAATSSAATSTAATSAPDSASSSAGAYHQGTLSTGAVAGIAVGAAVFLVLVCAMAGWLCLRRRRRRRRGGDDPDGPLGDRDAHDMLAVATKGRTRSSSLDDPDTPFAEDVHPRHRPLDLGVGFGVGSDSLARLNQSSATLSVAGESLAGSAAYSPHPRSPSPSPHRRPLSTVQLPERALGGGGGGGLYRDAPHQHSTSNLSNVINAEDDHGGGGDGHGDSDGDDNDDAHHPPSAVSRDSTTVDEGGPSAPGSRVGTPSPSPPPPRQPQPQPGHGRYRSRSATPGGLSISDQYAHLVEDGMTEDEIRRLEEEERALDEAIEQHRTESRATMGR